MQRDQTREHCVLSQPKYIVLSCTTASNATAKVVSVMYQHQGWPPRLVTLVSRSEVLPQSARAAMAACHPVPCKTATDAHCRIIIP